MCSGPSLHSFSAPLIPEVVRKKKSMFMFNNKNDNKKKNDNGCRRSFEDFLSMSVQVLDDVDGGNVVKNENDFSATTSLVLQKVPVSCVGKRCSICDQEGRFSFDNVSEAFALFLAKLPRNEGSTFIADRDRAMNYALVRDNEMVLDSGSEVHLLTPEAARRYFSNLRAANLEIVDVTGAKNANSAGDFVLTIVDQNNVRFGLRQ